jgi:hypothetical protein
MAENALTQGVEIEEPLLTLRYAVETAAVAGDIIVVAAGHTETFSTDLVIDVAGIDIVGCGSGTGRPTMTKAAVTNAMFDVTAAGVSIRNLYCVETTPAEGNTSTPFIRDGARGVVVESCDFLQAESPSAINFIAGSGQPRIDGCTFYNVRTTEDSSGGAHTVTDEPMFAIRFTHDDTICARITNCTFNGGSSLVSGYDQGAIHIDTGVTIAGFFESGNTFLYCTDLVNDGTLRGFGSGSTWSGSERISTDRIRWFNLGIVPQTADSASDTWYGGNSWLYAKNAWCTGEIYYVSSELGSDDNDGKDPTTPFATLNAALQVVSGAAGDLILVASDHAETISAEETAHTVKPHVKVFGLGSGSARPLLTLAYAGRWIDLDAAGQEIHGIRFTSSGVTVRSETIKLSAVGTAVEGCSFSATQYETSSVNVAAAALDSRIESNTFTCSSYSVTNSLPEQGLLYQVTGAGNQQVTSNQFSAGTSARWKNGGMCNDGGGNSASSCELYNNTLTTRGHIVATTSVNWLVAGNTADSRTKVSL